MQEHGVAVSFFWTHHQEKEIERIENSRFKMGPERHSSKHVGVPKWDGVICSELIVEKLLHTQIKGYEVSSKKRMPMDKDVFEKKERCESEDQARRQVFLAGKMFHSEPRCLEYNIIQEFR
jgi:hypothetical protein